MPLRHVILGITATLLLLLGLGLTRMLQMDTVEKEFVLTKIETVSLTPPPAPPMEEQPEVMQELESLTPPPPALADVVPTLNPVSFAVPLAEMSVDPHLEVDLFSEEVVLVETSVAQLPTVAQPKAPKLVKPRVKKPVEKSSFSLGDLDSKPSLVRSARFRWPNQVRDKVVTASVHVEINEHGQIRVLGVNSLSAPAFRPTLLKFIEASRFSAPKHKGQPVKVRYIWPLTLKKP